MSYFQDQDFQEKLLVPYCKDRNFLKRVSGILAPDDFKPRRGEGMIEAYWIAQAAAKYWKDYREPIAGMLKTEMLDYIRVNKKRIGSKSRERLMDLVESIQKGNGMVAVEAIEKKVIDYKRRKQMKRAVNELIELQENGGLSPEKWMSICRKAVEFTDHTLKISDYTNKESVEKRIKRREKDSGRKFPLLFIDPLDQNIRTFPRGEFGMGLAKYKIGKSTFAVHLAQSYALQEFNVLLFTLEDPGEMVEDRMDAAFTGIPMKRLMDKSNKLKRRMRRRLQIIRGKIKIVDGTDGGMSLQRMEEVWENFRNQGFDADVVICDYDEGVVPAEHHNGDGGERREMMEIYKDWKRFISRRQLYGWILAQTKRGKSGQRKMVVTGDDAAIDISKVKRCGMCIGIGDGPEDFGDDGRYLFIAAHRYDKSRLGWPIKGNFQKAIFYDKELTVEATNALQDKKKE
jgi:hypothetical protein